MSVTRFGVGVLALTMLLACGDDDGLTDPFGSAGAGRTIYGVDASNNLIAFGALTPGTRASQVSITGLAAGETIVGLDFRPATDVLYGVSSASRLYTINVATGAATAANGGALTATLNGTAFGVGFNPQVDRFRVHSNTEQNLRINQTSTPPAVLVDAPLAYITGDRNFGANPSIVGTAYTLSNNPAPAATELYAIDAALDVLVELDLPNGGLLATVGSLNFNTTDDVGYDIAGDTDVAYASLTPSTAPGGPSRLFTINMRSGVATIVGPIGHPTPLRSIAVGPGAPPAPFGN